MPVAVVVFAGIMAFFTDSSREKVATYKIFLFYRGAFYFCRYYHLR